VGLEAKLRVGKHYLVLNIMLFVVGDGDSTIVNDNIDGFDCVFFDLGFVCGKVLWKS
jgi:hypothetical protein